MSGRWFRNAEGHLPIEVTPVGSASLRIEVQPPRSRPAHPANLMGDVLRWGAIVHALDGADKFLIRGSRGVINLLDIQHPDYPRRALEAPAWDAFHRGPTTCGSTYTDVER